MILSESIALYVERKRSGGTAYHKGAQLLRSLNRHVGELELDRISAHDILMFLNGPKTSDLTWTRKWNDLKLFFDFWESRDEMPAPRPSKRSSFVPYIYTKHDMRRLLTSIRSNQRDQGCVLHAQTLRTILLRLYATGASVGEVIGLECRDVDVERGTLIVRTNRFERSRKIPLVHDLQTALSSYKRFRQKKQMRSASFFVTKHDQPVLVSNLTVRFQKLREAAGVKRQDAARYQPRLHDLPPYLCRQSRDLMDQEERRLKSDATCVGSVPWPIGAQFNGTLSGIGS